MATGLLLFGAPAQAAPTVPTTTFSAVTTDSATLEASLDPNGTRTFAHFAYVPQATFEDSGFTDALTTPEQTIQATVKGKGALKTGSSTISVLTTSQGTFAPGQSIKGEGIPDEATIIALGKDPKTGDPELVISKQATETATDVELTATGPQPLSAEITGLAPATQYRFRLEATNTKDEAATGPETTFYTLGLPPTFPTCSNDLFRSGELAPLDHPSARLPDCRAYEQASPVNKNGGDIQGDVPIIKAAIDGGGVTFASTFGVPGAEGAQELPTYLASRKSESWSSRGLYPPASAGQKAQVIGWSPDFSEVYSTATRLEEPRTTALMVQTNGGPPVEVAPYTPNADYAYAGRSDDGSIVLFESRAVLAVTGGTQPQQGLPNLYAWDRDTGQLSLAGVRNDETTPPKGALGGPYEWTNGISPATLRIGGAARGFYLQDEHAVTPSGDVYFTEAGTGQLFLRRNPTQPQSALDPEGHCTEPAKACTIHVSASQKTDGDGPGGIDAAGAQPAAFQAASADGKEVFFTSPEKLTNDANTGPEQALAQIERDDLAGGPVGKPDFISPQRAIGVAVDASHIYWADPSLGTIGRADIDGDPNSIEPSFIAPDPIQCEVEGKSGVFEDVDSKPRYVAVDAGHVYWTNTGCSDEFGALDGTGTIGRADIDGTLPSIEAEFITGASNPQGIAVNATHIYWANAARDQLKRAIGRAGVSGIGVVEQGFFTVAPLTPFGVALSGAHVYFSGNDVGNNFGFAGRITLAGGEEKIIFIGEAGIRGVATDASHVYWASQGEEAIGRADLDFTNQENEFTELEGKPNGVAADSEHLYWATNGETPTNPGNDLYRYGPGPGELTDLTPDDANINGAGVQGVVAASDDGKYVYFAANGVLAGGAQPGDCKGTLGSASGSCSLYLWHEGAISFVARLSGLGGEKTDTLNWAATPVELFSTSSYSPKTSFLSADGRSLLFRSKEKLTAYDNEGVPQFYRFRVGEEISCLSCAPTGQASQTQPRFGSLAFPSLGPPASLAAVSTRFLSADGNRAFFETSDALVAEDTNAADGCPVSGTSSQAFSSCQDVYEWEAPGTGTCETNGPAYSPLNEGCLYLLSTGKSPYPSFLADASASGDDVFIFTRDQLVRQDTDSITDVYDVRVGGGLAGQNQPPVTECEGELCKPSATPPPAYVAPPNFIGPPNPKPKRCKPAKKKKKSCKKKNKHNKRGKHHRSRR